MLLSVFVKRVSLQQHVEQPEGGQQSSNALIRMLGGSDALQSVMIMTHLLKMDPTCARQLALWI